MLTQYAGLAGTAPEGREAALAAAEATGGVRPEALAAASSVALPPHSPWRSMSRTKSS